MANGTAALRPKEHSALRGIRSSAVRYLTLSADYGQLSLRDEREGQITPAQMGLPSDLLDALTAWNDEYQPIIPLGAGERRQAASEIEALDQKGLQLAARLADACQEDAKVSYYSEGLGKRLP